MAENPSGDDLSSPAPSRQYALWTVVICGAMLAIFAAISFAAELTKCATTDEPMHGLASYMVNQFDDYRFNPEDPAGWQHWTGLAEPAHALFMNRNDPGLAGLLVDWKAPRWRWIVRTLYMTPGNDPDLFLRRERCMLLSLGVLLGGLVALWSWRIAGATAAITSVTLFAFDPNFLAHSIQIKDDVAITFTACALAFAAWCVGRRLSIGSFIGLLIAASLPLVTKFSGPLQIIFLAILLACRAIIPGAWICFGKQIRIWYAKFAISAGLFVICLLSAYLTIWASYSFRFAPTASGAQWDFEPMLKQAAINDVSSRHPELDGAPIPEINAWKPDALIRGIDFCDAHRLLPQTWLYGMLYTYQSSFVRQTYLNGQIRKMGCWQYFPIAFLCKTPIASQLAVLIGLATIVAVAFGLRRTGVPREQAMNRLWAATSLLIPFTVLLVADLRSKLDLGVRHLLPVYPFLYIAASVGIAFMIRKLGKRGAMFASILAVGLVVETMCRFPNYIAFFNVAVGGPRGGFDYLGDSNLDWGQDLPTLAKWQRENPDKNLYLCYFGTADPVYYGIRYQPLPDTMSLRDHDVELTMPRAPGVIAISATFLQGIYVTSKYQNVYGVLRDNAVPIAILNGTIYLFNYPPR